MLSTFIIDKSTRGKTTKLYNLVIANWNEAIDIVVCDIHSINGRSITKRLQEEKLSNISYAITVNQIINAIDGFNKELQTRKENNSIDLPVLLLVVDEYSVISKMLPKELQTVVKDCENIGRMYNLFVFVTSQQSIK